jgi:predicted RND superfamily exporter protein
MRPAGGELLFRLIDRAIARPWRVLAICALAVTAAAPGLLRLELRTDGHALVPANDEAILFDAEVREHFGLRDPIVVYLESAHPDGIFNQDTLRRVARLSSAFAELGGVGPEQVISLATERRDRVYPGTLKFRPLLDPFPDTPEKMATLRGDLEAIGILYGTLVSADRKATAILVGVPNLPPDAAPHAADRIELYRQILALVEPHRRGGDRIEVVGAPVAEFLLGVHLLEDLRLLLPLAFLVMALTIYAGCRRLGGVLFCFAEVGTCLVLTFGLMGWLDVPVYLPTAILPVILTTIGLADEIHTFWLYQELLEQHGEAAGRGGSLGVVRQTMREMAGPIGLTSLTTIVGFLSFATSPITPVRAFGVFAAVGIFTCMVFSLLVTPAAFALLPPGSLSRPHRAARRAWPEWLANLQVRRPAAVLAFFGILTLALGAGAVRLFVQDSWLDGFQEGSSFRQATERVNRNFFGTHLLLVHLDASAAAPADADPERLDSGGRRGPLLSPALLAEIDAFEAFLRSRPEVGGVLGPASHLRTVRFLWQARRESSRELPNDAALVQRVIKRFDQARGETRRREVIDDELRRAVVTIFLKDANYRETAALEAAIEDYERRHLLPLGVAAGFAGDVAVSQAMIPAIVDTQVSSIALSLVGAFLTLCWLTRSLLKGFFMVLPTAAAIAWIFGIMGWTGIPLGVATSMFCAITLGIGIDYAIHFRDRYELARGRGEGEPARAALREAGPAIGVDAAAVALGFGILFLSRVPANHWLGLLVALALLASSMLTIGSLGILLSAAAKTRPKASSRAESAGSAP